MIYILYILTGALCYFIGYASATYYTRNIRQDYHDLKYEHTRFIDELVKLNQERLEYKSIADRFEEKRLTETRKHDLQENRLEAKCNHLITENKSLIGKNRRLENKNNQYKSNLKLLKKELKELTSNPDTANKLKLQRYQQEIRNLHQAVAERNNTIKELKKQVID